MPFFKKKIKTGRAYTRSASQSVPNPEPEHIALADRAYVVDGPTLVQKLKTHETDGLTEQDAKARLEECVVLSSFVQSLLI